VIETGFQALAPRLAQVRGARIGYSTMTKRLLTLCCAVSPT